MLFINFSLDWAFIGSYTFIEHRYPHGNMLCFKERKSHMHIFPIPVQTQVTSMPTSRRKIQKFTVQKVAAFAGTMRTSIRNSWTDFTSISQTNHEGSDFGFV